MRLGIFGGTFDPPHIAHMVLAQEACFQLRLDRMLWVLTPDPPHKQDAQISALPTRLKLLSAALADNPAFELSRVEIDRPGPHYAVDTVALISKQHPGAEVFYLIGGDSLHDLPTWHTPQRLIEQVSAFGVMRRPNDAVDMQRLEQTLPGIQSKIRWLDAPLLEISASQIRTRAARGEPFRYYLLPAVFDLIVAAGLYRKKVTFQSPR